MQGFSNLPTQSSGEVGEAVLAHCHNNSGDIPPHFHTASPPDHLTGPTVLSP